MIVESYEDVIRLSGKLLDNFWETIHTAISLTLKRHATGVIIDCSGITECNHAGAETFVNAMEYIDSHDARIICVGMPAQVLEVFKSTPEVRSQLPMADSIEQARRSLDLLSSGGPQKRKLLYQPQSRVVLLLTGDERDNEGCAQAQRVADTEQAEVILTYVISVPRDLPLQAPMERDEQRALAAVEEATKFFETKGIPSKPVVARARDVASGLEEVLQEQNAKRLVVPLSANPDRLEVQLELIRSILTKIKANVVFSTPAH